MRSGARAWRGARRRPADRDAIRDAHRGRIDEATFNAGLNAGQQLEAALQHATAAKHGGS